MVELAARNTRHRHLLLGVGGVSDDYLHFVVQAPFVSGDKRSTERAVAARRAARRTMSAGA